MLFSSTCNIVNVTCTTLTQGTIEEKIFQRQISKHTLSVLVDSSSFSSSSSSSSSKAVQFTTEELKVRFHDYTDWIFVNIKYIYCHCCKIVRCCKTQCFLMSCSLFQLITHSHSLTVLHNYMNTLDHFLSPHVLQDLFTLHENTSCITHDLLKCACTNSTTIQVKHSVSTCT